MSTATLDYTYPVNTITKPRPKSVWNPASMLTKHVDDALATPYQPTQDDLVLTLLKTDKGFQDLTQSLLSLSLNEEDEEPATPEAIGTAVILLGKSYEALGSDWVDPFLTVDGFGGLRMTWNRTGREVRAIIPRYSSKKRYIYLEEGSKYESIPGFTDLTLATVLQDLLAEKKGNLAIGIGRPRHP